jgi:hypothetical protein
MMVAYEAPTYTFIVATSPTITSMAYILQFLWNAKSLLAQHVPEMVLSAPDPLILSWV